MAVLMALTGPAWSATWYVSPTGNDNNKGTKSSPLKTIQTAVGNANPGDAIILEDGTYTGSGDVDVQIGQTLTIESLNGASTTVIDCAGSSSNQHQGFLYNGSGTQTEPAVLQGITFKNAYTGGNGGAVSLQGSILQVSLCRFTNNYGNSGGVFYEDSGSSLTLTNCSCASNLAETASGVLDNGGVLAAQGCTFASGSSTYSGVFSIQSASASLQNCVLSNNQTVVDGTIYAESSALRMAGCTLSGNSASQGTSGIYNVYGTVTADSCLFTGSSCASGDGGAYLDQGGSGHGYLTNCLISGNSAQNGGGVYVSGSYLTLSGCSLSGNNASSGGGAVYIGGGASVTLTDDVLWGDTAPSSPSTAEISNSNGGTLYATYSDIQLGHSGAGNIKTNPQFVSASVGNYKLAPTSPCLDAGVAVTGLTYDLAGRVRHNPPTMGAYEAGALWSVVASAIGPNKDQRVLWVSTSGAAWLWDIAPSGSSHTTETYQPPAIGDTPVALAVGPDNHAYLAWLEPNGSILVWNIPSTGTMTSATYAPGSTYTLTSLIVGPDSYVHLHWTNKEGQLLIWSVSPTGSITKSTYGPYN